MVGTLDLAARDVDERVGPHYIASRGTGHRFSIRYSDRGGKPAWLRTICTVELFHYSDYLTRVRITVKQSPLQDVNVTLTSTSTETTKDITDLFLKSLLASQPATANVPVLIDNNTITVTATADQQITTVAASMLNYSKSTSVVVSHVGFPDDSSLVPTDQGMEELVYEGNVIMLSFDMKAPHEGDAFDSLKAMNGLLRKENLRPLDFSSAINLLRAEITTGEKPFDMAQRLSDASIPILQSAFPNVIFKNRVVAGETMPARLAGTYRAAASARCVAGGADIQGCFDYDGLDAINELRVFRYHFFMDTAAGHRLVDRIVGANPGNQAGLAIIDSGFGNYTPDPCAGNPGFNTVADIPCRALFNMSSHPYSFNAVGIQIDATGAPLALNLTNLLDTADNHGTRVSAAAAGRGSGLAAAPPDQGRGVLGIGRHARVRPLKRGGGAAGDSYAVVGAIRDANVDVINISWGGFGAASRSGFLAAAIEGGMVNVVNLARANGKILVVAGPNNGRNSLGNSFPDDFAPRRDGGGTRTAATPLVMKICSTATTGLVDGLNLRGPEALSSFSGFGNRQSATAPGDNVLLPNRTTGVLGVDNGCSFAAPVVTGLAAEMIFLDRNVPGRAAAHRLSPLQIVELIEATAEDLGSNANAATAGMSRPNDNPGDGWDLFFGHGRISAWKALLSVANGGLATDRSAVFPSLDDDAGDGDGARIISDAETTWYGFRIITSVIGATVWIDGQQLQDNGATAPNNPAITAYKGVLSDQVISLGIPNEDPTSGVVPAGNNEGEYVMTFSIERRDLLEALGTPRTLSLRQPGQNQPYYNLKMELQKMRDGIVPGVVFDDFVFEITPTDFGDAPLSYNTLDLPNNGGRHLNTNLEWFGMFGNANVQSVTPEPDAKDNRPQFPDDTIDPDLRQNVDPNLGPNQDNFDDGVFFDVTTYKPGEEGRLVFSVCVADAASDRYDPADPNRALYVNGWIDWDVSGTWGVNENVVDGVRLTPDPWPMSDPDNKVTRLSPAAGDCARYEAKFLVPELGNGDVWSRFRVDYAENVGRPISLQPLFPSVPNLSETRGATRFGEVEDHLVMEVDKFPDTESRLTIQGPFGAFRVVLRGPTTIVVDLSNLADTDGNGMEQVQAEMVDLQLKGSSPIGPIAVRVRDVSKHPNQRSLGQIQESANRTPGVTGRAAFCGCRCGRQLLRRVL